MDVRLLTAITVIFFHACIHYGLLITWQRALSLPGTNVYYRFFELNV